MLSSGNPRFNNLTISDDESVGNTAVGLFGEVETVAVLVGGLVELSAPTARERRPDEVVVGKPVVEDWHKGLPLTVPLLHRRLLRLRHRHNDAINYDPSYLSLSDLLFYMFVNMKMNCELVL